MLPRRAEKVIITNEKERKKLKKKMKMWTKLKKLILEKNKQYIHRTAIQCYSHIKKPNLALFRNTIPIYFTEKTQKSEKKATE